MSVEIPLVMLIGITFSLILLDGKDKVIHFILTLIVDVGTAFYTYVLKDFGSLANVATSTEDYIRLEFAVVMSGVLCGFFILNRNNSLDREMQTREEANKRAEEVSFAKDMFLVNVSHEIRTPLNAIIGTTDMLLDSEANNHVKEMAYNISNSSHALLSITTDLLDFSRMNVDSLTPTVDKYDLPFMLNDIINLMSVRLLDSNVEFFVEIDPNIPKTLYGDSGKIRQVIINMLSNAIKYTKEGHMTFKVDFERKADDEIVLLISVEDTGIGIKEESIEKIFMPYNRSGEMTDRMIEGNGLGLALCKKIASSMGGSIEATSVFGKGSTFYFNVPQKTDIDIDNHIGFLKNPNVKLACFCDSIQETIRLISIADEMKVTIEKPTNDIEFIELIGSRQFDYYMCDTGAYERLKERINEVDPEWEKIVVISNCNYSYAGEPFEYVLTKPVSCLNISDLINENRNFALRKQIFDGRIVIPNATVLVVDDNIVNLEVAAGILKRFEPKVITAASGKEALLTLKEEHIDIIFLDYMMPDMDGIDTLKAIRAMGGEYEKLPVVALTANVVSGAREMFIQAGFDDYLSKPMEIDMLEKTLNDFIPKELIKVSLEQ